MTIAALYIDAGGVYSGRPDVDVWDEARDARTCAGPWPVVAHPPCGPWGVYARCGWTRAALGDDAGCFSSALASVRRWGGVLEHPARSSAWAAHGPAPPPSSGGWIITDRTWWGLSCALEQGSYGMRCRKPTWLYACLGSSPPALRWGPSSTAKGYRTLGQVERRSTPPAFAELLLSLARLR